MLLPLMGFVTPQGLSPPQNSTCLVDKRYPLDVAPMLESVGCTLRVFCLAAIRTRCGNISSLSEPMPSRAFATSTVFWCPAWLCSSTLKATNHPSPNPHRIRSSHFTGAVQARLRQLRSASSHRAPGISRSRERRPPWYSWPSPSHSKLRF